jgi:uncharacterized protein YjbI with pentapeptide repeats
MKQINHAHRDRIVYAIKNQQDVSDLLVGYDIRGLDLTGAVIHNLNVSNQDISNTNFTRAVIGSNNGSVNLNRVIANNCSFIGTMFPGPVTVRRATFHGCNFTGAFMPYADYRFSKFTACKWCDAVFRIGTHNSIGAIFDDSFFGDLSAHWGVRVIRKTAAELASMEE